MHYVRKKNGMTLANMMGHVAFLAPPEEKKIRIRSTLAQSFDV